MSGHTPGPWTVRTGAFGLYISATMDADTDQRIRLADMPRDEDDAETRANAALIASAPELLGALRGMLDLYSEHDDCRDGADPEHGPDGACRACSARSAIARAEGRGVRP